MSGGSLVARLTGLLQAVTVLVVAAFASLALWLTAGSLLREEAAQLEMTARHVAENLDREFQEERRLAPAAENAVAEEAPGGLRVEVLDLSGRLLAATGGAGPAAPGPRARAVAPAAGAEPPRPGWRSSDRGLDSFTARARCGAWVRASMPARFRVASLAALGRSLLLAALPILLLALLLGWRLSRGALAPLSGLAARAGGAPARDGVRSLGPPVGLREIDELIAAFDRLLGRLDDLLRSERRFTSDASHELRTPLTVLSGELEMALADPALPAPRRAGLERAFEQVSAMRDLTDALLLMRGAADPGTRPAEGFETVNLSDVAAELAAEALLRHPERERDLEVDAPDEALVSGQPALLAAAARNLLDNALKFTQPGQAVRVTVAAGDPVTLTVDDGGPGIPPGDLERVFDPFFRGAEARATRAGFGLGLPILKCIAQLHGGEVSAEDSPEGGARFVMRLPAWTGR